MEEVKPDTRIVFELSCHQLEYMTVSPHIGILVNIHEEHLDHYGTMEKYVEAKRCLLYTSKQFKDGFALTDGNGNAIGPDQGIYDLAFDRNLGNRGFTVKFNEAVKGPVTIAYNSYVAKEAFACLLYTSGRVTKGEVVSFRSALELMRMVRMIQI